MSDTAVVTHDWIVDEIDLGAVTALPEWHPESEAMEGYRVYGWLVRGEAMTILVDTGIGFGSDVIDEWYAPETVEVGEALAQHGVEIGDVDRVVVSHLHFDHCGQLGAFDVPVVVQKAELALLENPIYTVAEWADRPDDGWHVIDGDLELAPGVRVLSTPGHTPGHQSVVVETAEGTVVIGGQCSFRREGFVGRTPEDTNIHDENFRSAAKASLERLAGLDPVRVYLSHDRV